MQQKQLINKMCDKQLEHETFIKAALAINEISINSTKIQIDKIKVENGQLKKPNINLRLFQDKNVVRHQ